MILRQYHPPALGKQSYHPHRLSFLPLVAIGRYQSQCHNRQSVGPLSVLEVPISDIIRTLHRRHLQVVLEVPCPNLAINTLRISPLQIYRGRTMDRKSEHTDNAEKIQAATRAENERSR